MNESIGLAVGLLVFIGLGIIAIVVMLLVGYFCIKRKRANRKFRVMEMVEGKMVT